MSQNNLSRPPHAGMRHVALNVINLAAMEHFYCELLGFEVEWRPDADNVYLCSGNDNLALHVVSEMAPVAPEQHHPLAHTGIIVDKIAQVDDWFRFLQANNVAMVTEPKTHRDGARSFYCYDPQKIVLQIIFHPPLSAG
jgi:catechol 2,3-dioxygenase-like lactoylglutathione lyase family enzyme